MGNSIRGSGKGHSLVCPVRYVPLINVWFQDLLSSTGYTNFAICFLNTTMSHVDFKIRDRSLFIAWGRGGIGGFGDKLGEN